MGSLPHVMFTDPKPTKDSETKPPSVDKGFQKHLSQSFHSPPQITYFRKKIAHNMHCAHSEEFTLNQTDGDFLK